MARVLVADDEKSVREILSIACQSEGHEVQQAFDAASAVTAYRRFRPDLLILDLFMPGGGGAEVLKRIRAGDLALCRLIVVSGRLEDMTSEDRAALGADAFIEKPFTVETLQAAVRSALTASPGAERNQEGTP